MPLHFSKMHGAGNHFVMLDRRGAAAPLSAAMIAAMADPQRGVGFDQLITIEASRDNGCVAAYRIWNSDGSSAQQCGNGARCVAAWLRRDGSASRSHFALHSPAGRVDVEVLADGRYALDLGVPDFRPAALPFRAEAEAACYELDLALERVRFGAVSMGNPHALIEVGDIAEAPLALIGPLLQQQREFPDSVNVGFAQVLAPDRIALRVFERGAGETLACGSGACAAVAVLVRQGRVQRHVAVQLPGGMLEIDWPRDDAPVRMTGPATFVFEGEWLDE